MKLKLAEGFELPPDVVTHTMGLLAVRGAGKTNGARVIAEEMYRAELPFVAIDPVGSWWGLRAGRDGKPEGGLRVPILGGKHADAPLERAQGEQVADLIVRENLSCVLDLSDFESEAAKKSFLLDFAKQLYRVNETARHLFLEEADDYIPQRPIRDEILLLRAWENIVRRGRGRGLGMTLITQRSASVNKNVLTQVETLFVMRTTGPQDRAAVEAWVAHNDAGVGREELAALPSFKSGEAWCWSPHMLGKSVRFRFRLSSTYDSGATPKAGEARRACTLADVELEALRSALEPPAPKGKGKRGSMVDPTEGADASLAQVAELQALLRVREQELAQHEARLQVEDGQLERLERAAREIERAGLEVVESARDLVGRLPPRNGSRESAPAVAAPPSKPNGSAHGKTPAAFWAEKARAEASGLEERCRRILLVLAQHGPCTVEKLALLAGYTASGGSFKNGLGKCRSQGWVEPGPMPAITPKGLAVLGPYDPLPRSPAALLDVWLGLLEGRERTVLKAAVAAHPRELTPPQLAYAAGYEPTGGSFKNALGRLRTLGLVSKGGKVRVARELVG